MRRSYLPLACLTIAFIGSAIGLMCLPRDTGAEDAHWEAVGRGQAYLDRGRPDLALRAVYHIRDERPGAALAMTIAGLALAQMDDPHSARMALERALALDPDQPGATKVLAAVYLAFGDAPRGLRMLQEAARMDPDDYRPWLAMGRVHHDMGELEKAAEAYGAALRLKPGDPEARSGRIRELLAVYRPAEVPALLDEAMREQPENPELLGLAAILARDLGQFREALDFVDRALTRDPRNFDARYARATILVKSGQFEQILEDLEVAVEVRPLDLGAQQLLATIQARLGLAEEAAGTLRKTNRTRELRDELDRYARLIPLRPNDPEPRWRLAMVAAEASMTVLARQSYQAALDLDPNCREAIEGLAALPDPDRDASQPSGPGEPATIGPRFSSLPTR